MNVMNAETISWIYFWTAVGSGMAMLVWGAWLLISNMAGREDAEKNLAETSAALQASESVSSGISSVAVSGCDMCATTIGYCNIQQLKIDVSYRV